MCFGFRFIFCLIGFKRINLRNVFSEGFKGRASESFSYISMA